jgi:hypothetical protein
VLEAAEAALSATQGLLGVGLVAEWALVAVVTCFIVGILKTVIPVLKVEGSVWNRLLNVLPVLLAVGIGIPLWQGQSVEPGGAPMGVLRAMLRGFAAAAASEVLFHTWKAGLGKFLAGLLEKVSPGAPDTKNKDEPKT